MISFYWRMNELTSPALNEKELQNKGKFDKKKNTKFKAQAGILQKSFGLPNDT